MRFSKVQTSLWDSERFNKVNEFSKLVYIYLLTCPHGNSVGLFKLKQAYALADLHCTDKRYNTALDNLQKAGLIKFENEVIYINQFLRFSPCMNKSHAQGNASAVSKFCDNPLYVKLYKDVERYCPDHLGAFSEPKHSVDTVQTQCQDGVDTGQTQYFEPETQWLDGDAKKKEKEKKKDKDKENNTHASVQDGNPSSSFKKPTLEEVTSYCQERDNNVNPQAFIDHYEANGWFRGKTKIKSWKACVRTWEQNAKEKPAKEPERNSDYDDLF